MYNYVCIKNFLLCRVISSSRKFCPCLQCFITVFIWGGCSAPFYSVLLLFTYEVVVLPHFTVFCYCLQMRRLRECERMLVALELAGWLNEANLALQAVVQCYGLLAPLIFYKIPSVAVVQVHNIIHSIHWSIYRSKGYMQRSFQKSAYILSAKRVQDYYFTFER